MSLAEDRAFATSVEVAARHAPIRVALIGGPRLLRAALRHLIQSDAGFQFVAESETADPGIQSSKPDVVVLDIDGCGDSLDLLQRVQPSAKGPAILLLVTSGRQSGTDALLLAGAHGVVFKDVADSHLLTAIRKVSEGELWVDRATTSRLVRSLSDRRRVITAAVQRVRIESLSRREAEVVTFVADGLCNKAIAKKMGISDNTVRHHLTSIFTKLGTRDRLELVIYAFRQGIVKATA